MKGEHASTGEVARLNTTDQKMIFEKKALNHLFDDAIDELEVTFDIYFEVERYRPRCVHVVRRMFYSGIKEGKVLVLGSNERPFTMLLRKMGFQAEGLSFHPVMNEGEGTTMQKVSSYVQAIRNVQGEYDTIICDDVLQHIESPLEILEILNDHLKPGGVLMVTTPNAARGTSRLRLVSGRNVYPWPFGGESPDGHVQRLLPYREYTLSELDTFVKNIGFGLIKSEFIIGIREKANTWPPLPIKEYFFQIIFLAVQKIAAPLRTFLFVAARKPLVQRKLND
jgi:SAM-dependent methyltransferase